MIELKIFVKVLLFICFSLDSVGSKKKYPSIQDVVSFDEPVHQYYIPNIVKEVKSSLNMDLFRKNKALLRSHIRDYLEDATAYETRRQDQKRDHRKIAKIEIKTRIIDCMLQLVYMARHWMKIFEKADYMDKRSLSYRVGYLAWRLKYYYGKARKIFDILNLKQRNGSWTAIPAPLNLHHKVAKLTTDFDYNYFLIKKLHSVWLGKQKESPPFQGIRE